MNASATPPVRGHKGRWILIVLFVVILGPVLVAGVLRFSGWKPQGTRNHGEMLKPVVDLRAVVPQLAEGGDYAWSPAERMWRIALAPPTNCGPPCASLLHDLDKTWQLFGHDADHVEILWIGEPVAGAPAYDEVRMLRADPALRERLLRVDDPAGVPVYVIDPNGFVVLRYAPGFDPLHLRADVSKLLKLM